MRNESRVQLAGASRLEIPDAMREFMCPLDLD
jgi:hypothetical protein